METLDKSSSALTELIMEMRELRKTQQFLSEQYEDMKRTLPPSTRGVRTQGFSSPTPVLIQEVGILIGSATIKNFWFWKVVATGPSVDLRIWKFINLSPAMWQ